MQGVNDSSPDKLRGILDRPDFSGQILAEEVRRLVDVEGTSVDALMVELLPAARTYSRPPLSNFRVGAVARGSSGSLYLGANIEVPGQALGLTVHAEQAALANAYMHGDEGVAAIAVTAVPCGHCRQFMIELSAEGEMQVLVGTSPGTRLSALLPMAFGPRNLGVKQGAFPVNSVELALASAIPDDLAAAALAAAKKSYAPYTKAYSGIAIRTKNGRLHRGSYIENAAFNPSLSPFQTGLVALILAGQNASEISRVVLVEVEGALISQKSSTEATLSALAPGAKLRLLRATLRT